MRHVRLLALPLVLTAAASAFVPTLRAQQPAGDPGVVADDDLTFVVATRFVVPTAEQSSPTALFDGRRVPLASFNDTDRCVDDRALEAAQDYFTALGRALGKAGYYYFIPDDTVEDAIRACANQHRSPPKAFVSGKTKILAFGKVVPKREAPALEEALR